MDISALLVQEGYGADAAVFRTQLKAHQNWIGEDLAVLVRKSGVSSNPVRRATNGVWRSETRLKQGYLMLTDANLFTRVIRDLSGAVERIDDRDVDRVVSCISNARHVSVFGCGA